MNQFETRITPTTPERRVPRTEKLSPLGVIPGTNPSLRIAETANTVPMNLDTNSSKTIFQQPFEVKNESSVDRDMNQNKEEKTDPRSEDDAKKDTELKKAQAQAQAEDVAVVSRLRDRVWSDVLHKPISQGDEKPGLQKKRSQTMSFGGNAAELLIAHAHQLEEKRRATEAASTDRERRQKEKAQALAGLEDMNNAVIARLAQDVAEQAQPTRQKQSTPSLMERMRGFFG